MRIDPIQLKSLNQLIIDYRKEEQKLMKYFDYSPFHSYKQRVNDLKNREFNREQLTEILSALNKEWNAPESTYHNIERLKEKDSVVVIGGQQAGLLTGPMYTINKLISIIQFAKQQEEELKIPVIPVFWIAGEDHDYDEINHVHLTNNSEIKKHTIPQYVGEKTPISNIVIDQIDANDWLNKLFEQLKETKYTKDLYHVIQSCLDKSSTFVDFFARLIFKLFSQEGVVLIDSNHPKVRHLESSFFIEMIEKQPAISEEVFTTFQQLKTAGYSVPVDVEQKDAHLFLQEGNERILLERNEEGDWIGKQNEVSLSTQELIHIAQETPELLSNNVITRPLMQELLFPTLAFVAGNGEISYWAVLKSAFHQFNTKMPPVLPRLSLTFIDRHVEKYLEKYSVSAIDSINQGIESFKGNWLASQSNPPIHLMSDQLKHAINDVHRPFRKTAKAIRSDLGELANKNLEYIYKEITYLENRINRALEEKYDQEISEFDRIQMTLNPYGELQERIWNPLLLINEHGLSFLEKLTSEICSFEEEHYLVYL